MIKKKDLFKQLKIRPIILGVYPAADDLYSLSVEDHQMDVSTVKASGIFARGDFRFKTYKTCSL